jgi:hypothetical protein
MSSPYAVDRGDWHCAKDVFTESWLAPHRAFFAAHAHDPPITQDRELEHQALHNIVHHPGKYLENLADNASRILFNAPYSQRPPNLRVTAFVIPGAILVALLALSLARLAWRRATLPPEGVAFCAFAAVAFLVHLPISAYVRMLIPMVPPLLWVIVFVLDRWFGARPAGSG